MITLQQLGVLTKKGLSNLILNKEKDLAEIKEPTVETGQALLKVKKVEWISSEVFELKLDRGNIQFSPGDCVSIFEEGGKTSRPYSIASGTGEGELRFFIRQMEDGVVTEYLATLEPGDRVKVSLPYGWFRPGQEIEDSPFVFIATGTGIAPFLSYCQSYPERPPQQILFGVRTLNEAAGFEFLKNICPVHLAVSREKIKSHHHGRVTDLLEDLPVSEQVHYYLCGLDEMINEVTEWLESKGVSALNIHREVFFHASH